MDARQMYDLEKSTTDALHESATYHGAMGDTAKAAVYDKAAQRAATRAEDWRKLSGTSPS